MRRAVKRFALERSLYLDQVARSIELVVYVNQDGFGRRTQCRERCRLDAAAGNVAVDARSRLFLA